MLIALSVFIPVLILGWCLNNEVKHSHEQIQDLCQWKEFELWKAQMDKIDFASFGKRRDNAMKVRELLNLEEERKELEKKREDLQELMKNIGSIDYIDLVYKFNKHNRFYVEDGNGRVVQKEERVITEAMKKAECEAIKELTADIDARLEQLKETADKANKLLEGVVVPAPKVEQEAPEPAIASEMIEQYEEGKSYPSASHGACFHGENWYHCPHCNASIEAYSFQFEDGVKKIADGIYRCDNCQKLMEFRR